jgi:hypothetical protein
VAVRIHEKDIIQRVSVKGLAMKYKVVNDVPPRTRGTQAQGKRRLIARSGIEIPAMAIVARNTTTRDLVCP